jgi:DNA-binding MarR family transcriptional regulator
MSTLATPSTQVDPRTLEAMHLLLRILRFGDDLAAGVVDRVEHKELVQNLPAVVVLALLEHGTLRPAQISALTGLSSGGVSGLLERLEASGLIVRHFGRVPGDRRGVVVELTSSGTHDALILADSIVAPMERLLDDLAAIRAGRDELVLPVDTGS